MTKQLRRIQFALLLPLSTKNELIGFVSLGARLGDLPYSANDEQLLMSVAGQITLALENARLVEGMLEEGRKRTTRSQLTLPLLPRALCGLRWRACYRIECRGSGLSLPALD